jgi:predicted lipoprotein
MRLLLTPLVACLAALAGPAQAENAVIADAVSGFVRPVYTEFHASASQLRGEMETLCAGQSPDKHAAAQSSFVATVVAWSEAEIIRFGPITEANRLERILFWPDRKSTGLKQVQAALASKDATATDPKTLAGKSVAMQGLGALEFVLFGTGSEALRAPGDPYRCAFGLAITRNVEDVAAAVDDEWKHAAGFSRDWINPAAGNPRYRSDAEAMNELVGIFVHGLEMVRDVRLNGFLGKTPDADKPRQGVFWRAGATIASIQANLRGMRKLFEAAGFGRLLGSDTAYIAGSIDFEFANADKALGQSQDLLDRALADPGKREGLVYARLVTSSLSELFGVKLSSALGLTAGFSSLDGD